MGMKVDLNSLTIDPVITQGVTDFSGDVARYISITSPVAGAGVALAKSVLRATGQLEKAKKLKDRFLNAPGYFAGQAGNALQRVLTGK